MKYKPTPKTKIHFVIQFAATLLLWGCVNTPQSNEKEQENPASKNTQAVVEKTILDKAGDPPHILVFTKTKAYRHKNISDGVYALREIGKGTFVVEQTEDAGVFTIENLKRFSAIVFLSTTGDVLNKEQQGAFEQYIHSGGGFVGIHAAADTEYDWPWYGQLVGAWFKDHTDVILATVRREDKTHISTIDFPDSWRRADEWYRFRTNPRENVRVLVTVNDQDLGEVTMNGDHPISWMHEFDGGRAWYTGMGHTKESFLEPEFRKHVLGGIVWAMGTRANLDLNQPNTKPVFQTNAPTAK
ncbi:MAG: ThuA domain-containing protein [Phycisphaerales bacterium]